MHVKCSSRTLLRFSSIPHLSRTWLRLCHSQALEEVAGHRSEATGRMSAWQVRAYGEGSNVEFSNDVEVPIIEDPNHVLLKVAAASVNPLDIEMMRGFGSVLLNSMRQIESLCQSSSSTVPELPLILGRDFAGTVVGKGSSVTEFDIGDEVYGVVKPQNRGCHAEFALTYDKLLAKKPEFISMEEASGILYTSLTAWSALKITGGLIITPSRNKRVLVLGASGGVGNAAVQLLQAWDANVVATCRTDAIPFVEKLSPEMILDYTSPTYSSDIKQAGPFDIILDAAGLPETELEKYVDSVNSCGSIITLRSPLLSNIDTHGILYGSVKSAIDLIMPNLTSGVFRKGSLIKWGFFMPCETAVKEISSIVSQNKLIPAIEKVYQYSETPEAYDRMKASHLRGKIVISLKGEQV